MSKYIDRAKEINTRLQTLIDAFEIRKGSNGWPDDYIASSKIKEQYPDILLDVQNLFFCDSPQSPLYARAMNLNERVFEVSKDIHKSFFYSDFIGLKELLSKYFEYRAFLEAED